MEHTGLASPGPATPRLGPRVQHEEETVSTEWLVPGPQGSIRKGPVPPPPASQGPFLSLIFYFQLMRSHWANNQWAHVGSYMRLKPIYWAGVDFTTLPSWLLLGSQPRNEGLSGRSLHTQTQGPRLGSRRQRDRQRRDPLIHPVGRPRAKAPGGPSEG